MGCGVSPDTPSNHDQSAQAEGRDRIRAALLKSATQEFSRFGYADAVLGLVANEFSSSVQVQEESTAGDSSLRAAYSRPELYTLFANREELALAVVQWAEDSWVLEVGHLLADEATDPMDALLAVARGHAVYCRQDVGRVIARLAAEFEGRDHPVGRAGNEALGRLIDHIVRLITKGRRSGAIPPGPPPRELSVAYLGVLERVVEPLRGHAPFDALLAEKAVSGLLGLAHTSETRTR